MAACLSNNKIQHANLRLLSLNLLTWILPWCLAFLISEANIRIYCFGRNFAPLGDYACYFPFAYWALAYMAIAAADRPSCMPYPLNAIYYAFQNAQETYANCCAVDFGPAFKDDLVRRCDDYIGASKVLSIDEIALVKLAALAEEDKEFELYDAVSAELLILQNMRQSKSAPTLSKIPISAH
jgi:hypothetical protein